VATTKVDTSAPPPSITDEVVTEKIGTLSDTERVLVGLDLKAKV